MLWLYSKLYPTVSVGMITSLTLCILDLAAIYDIKTVSSFAKKDCSFYYFQWIAASRRHDKKRMNLNFWKRDYRQCLAYHLTWFLCVLSRVGGPSDVATIFHLVSIWYLACKKMVISPYSTIYWMVIKPPFVPFKTRSCPFCTFLDYVLNFPSRIFLKDGFSLCRKK